MQPHRRLTATLVIAGVACAALMTHPSAGQVDLEDLGRTRDRSPDAAESLVKTRIVADADRIVPGTTFEIAVVFDIAPKWHIYWENAGESGGATEIAVKTPPGFTVGPARFPRPRIFRDLEGVTYGYTGQVAILVPIKAPDRLDHDEVTLQADVFFLVCRGRCFLGDAKLEIRLPVAAASADPAVRDAPRIPPPSGDRKLLDRYRRRLPQPIESLSGATARRDGDRLLITGPAGAYESVQFLPIEVPGVRYDAAEIEVDGGRFRVSVPVRISPQNAGGKPMSLRGVLGMGGDPDAPCYSFELPMEHSP